MKPVLKKLPHPSVRLDFINAKLLAEVKSRADGVGIAERRQVADLEEYLAVLARDGHLMLTANHVAVTSLLAAALERENAAADGVDEALTVRPVTLRVAALFPELVEGPPRPKLSRARFTVLLARALQAAKISPQVHSVLTCVVNLQAGGRAATLPAVMDELGCSYNSLVHHATREGAKHTHLFHVNRNVTPLVLEISESGLALLRDVDVRIARYAAMVGC